MIRYDPTLVGLTIKFFVLGTNVKVCLDLYNEEQSMNIHEGKG